MTAFTPEALKAFKQFADLAHLHQKHPQQLAHDGSSVGSWPPESPDQGWPQPPSAVKDQGAGPGNPGPIGPTQQQSFGAQASGARYSGSGHAGMGDQEENGEEPEHISQLRAHLTAAGLPPDHIDRACQLAQGRDCTAEKAMSRDEPPEFEGGPRVGAGANAGPAQGGMRNRGANNGGAQDSNAPRSQPEAPWGGHIDVLDVGFYGSSDAAQTADRTHYLRKIDTGLRARIGQDSRREAVMGVVREDLGNRSAQEGAGEAAFLAELSFVKLSGRNFV
jgi:hypothetical protein